MGEMSGMRKLLPLAVALVAAIPTAPLHAASPNCRSISDPSGDQRKVSAPGGPGSARIDLTDIAVEPDGRDLVISARVSDLSQPRTIPTDSTSYGAAWEIDGKRFNAFAKEKAGVWTFGGKGEVSGSVDVGTGLITLRSVGSLPPGTATLGRFLVHAYEQVEALVTTSVWSAVETYDFAGGMFGISLTLDCSTVPSTAGAASCVIHRDPAADMTEPVRGLVDGSASADLRELRVGSTESDVVIEIGVEDLTESASTSLLYSVWLNISSQYEIRVQRDLSGWTASGYDQQDLAKAALPITLTTDPSADTVRLRIPFTHLPGAAQGNRLNLTVDSYAGPLPGPVTGLGIGAATPGAKDSAIMLTGTGHALGAPCP